MRLADPSWLAWLWALPALLVMFAVSWRHRRRAVARFAQTGLAERIGFRAAPVRHALRATAVVAAFGSIAVALARPQWDPTPTPVQRKGRDVVFLIDVSRSMLAQDLPPNRLDRSKLWINDLAGSLKGDRVGIVAFAGAASIRCPLTTDYAFFRLTLEELSTRSAPRGGTNIGDAIRKTIDDVFKADAESVTNYRDIVLITDGEDQDSLPVEAAQRARELGIRIIAIGIGSDTAGASIPIESDRGGERPLSYRGQEVRTSQDSKTLREIATASAGGVYLNVGTGTIDLEQVYADLIRGANQVDIEEVDSIRYREGFQYLLAIALTMLCLEVVIRDRA